MVSMSSIHFFRWTEQLKAAGHEVYWFDVVDGGKKVDRISWVHQIVGWKLRWDFPGRSYIKAQWPKVYSWLQRLNERNTAVTFEKIVEEIKPDVVHSFALYVACAPIVDIMKKHAHIKWIYSSWGSDLFYFQQKPTYLIDIKNVLPRVNYLFTDCKRDYQLAVKYGFNGEFLGVFPGGGGFDLEELNTYMIPFKQRKTILIKGYQGRSGRAIEVLKAMEHIQFELKLFKIVVFGADKEVEQYIKQSELTNWRNVSVCGKISHIEVLKLMGQALVYIGNSKSDGLPNTLLEAICMGAFPIQSNPGGVTEEVIEHGINGLLINDCESIQKIKDVVLKAISDSRLLKNAFEINQHKMKPNYNRKCISRQVLLKYENIEI
ncbi:MAG: glycosyltransferase family 4 protein [Lutibacter sp.]|nr:glycosyltransferase family 4 protein [Lutibacter sp.]